MEGEQKGFQGLRDQTSGLAVEGKRVGICVPRASPLRTPKTGGHFLGSWFPR